MQSLMGITIGLAVTGSHCTIEKVLPQVKELVAEGARVIPILSESVLSTDTRFGTAVHWRETLVTITGEQIIGSLVEAEPVGPQKLLDVMVIAPCTGNTLAKLANGITDGTVLMAAKAHLRNGRPLVIAISTNDGLGMNFRNIGLLFNTKNVYFVPFGQDDPVGKPRSLVASMQFLQDTIVYSLAGRQYQPVLLGSFTNLYGCCGGIVVGKKD